MSLGRESHKGTRNLIRGYEVWHKSDPEKTVKLRTLRTLTPTEVKEKIVRNGLFDRELFHELRVKRIGR
jgi:hypothetical protein